MSLLTQFYPGPGGGGGGGVGASAGLPSVVIGGMTSSPTTPTSGNATIPANANIYLPFGSAAIPSLSAFSGGTYRYITLNNILVSYVTLPSGATNVYFNNAILMSLDGAVGTTNLESIEGTGVIDSLNIQSFCSFPNFTSISTGIAFPVIAGLGGVPFRAMNCALDATTVNHILTSIVNNGGASITSGAVRTIDLSGGTSAGVLALTAGGFTAGLAAITTLTSAGWVVNLNA